MCSALRGPTRGYYRRSVRVNNLVTREHVPTAELADAAGRDRDAPSHPPGVARRPSRAPPSPSGHRRVSTGPCERRPSRTKSAASNSSTRARSQRREMSAGSPNTEAALAELPAMGHSVGALVSVNVGVPRDVPWHGKTVFTGVFKDSRSPALVAWSKLNVDGDGQGDLCRARRRAAGRLRLPAGLLPVLETANSDEAILCTASSARTPRVQGLSDDEVCVGDRYQIGTAVFEVTQPRVTCYRVGIRMNDPRIPGLARLTPPARASTFACSKKGTSERGTRTCEAGLRPGSDDGGRGRRGFSTSPATSASNFCVRGAHSRPQPRLANIPPGPTRGQKPGDRQRRA